MGFVYIYFSLLSFLLSLSLPLENAHDRMIYCIKSTPLPTHRNCDKHMYLRTPKYQPSLNPCGVARDLPGRVAQSVGYLTRKSEVLGSIPGLATYFRFSSGLILEFTARISLSILH